MLPMQRRHEMAQLQMNLQCPSSANLFVIISMTANPEPEYAFRNVDPKHTIMQPYAGGTKSSDLFKSQRRMGRIRFEQRELLIG